VTTIRVTRRPPAPVSATAPPEPDHLSGPPGSPTTRPAGIPHRDGSTPTAGSSAAATTAGWHVQADL